MDSKIIKQVSSAQYLGLTINEKLLWGEYISNITKKVNSALGFLHRNLRNCPTHIKISYYRSLVILILGYACTIWDPHTLKDTNQIEKIQRRAARFVYNNYSWTTSVTGLLQNLQWQSLKSRRKLTRIFFKLFIIYYPLLIAFTSPQAIQTQNITTTLISVPNTNPT